MRKLFDAESDPALTQLLVQTPPEKDQAVKNAYEEMKVEYAEAGKRFKVLTLPERVRGVKCGNEGVEVLVAEATAEAVSGAKDLVTQGTGQR